MPRVHVIMCTYLGEVELDINRTARWAQYFSDTIFFYDSNNSVTARSFAIPYARSLPDVAKFAYHDQNVHPGIYVDPSGFRRMAFEAADKAWNYDPTDWVIFIDATEGITVDVPHDALELLTPDSVMFRYLYDEIAAAGAATMLAIPMRIFLRQGAITERTYIIDAVGEITWQANKVVTTALLAAATDPADIALLTKQLATDNLIIQANRAAYWTCAPEYHLSALDTLRCVRMVQVNRARQGTFPWSQIDTYSASYAPLTGHVGLVSYSYARFSQTNYGNPSLWVQANDEGFYSRLLMQQIPGRAIAAIPTTYGTADPTGYGIVVPPGAARVSGNVDYETMTFTFTAHVTNESGNETYAWTFGDAGTGTGQTVTHVYATVDGTAYTVTATINDPDVGSPRTATMIVRPGGTPTISPQAPIPPNSATTRSLSPPYCYYVNQFGAGSLTYVQVFSALWRKSIVRWQDIDDLGPLPTNPVSGLPDIGVDPLTGLPHPTDLWYQQTPPARVL